MESNEKALFKASSYMVMNRRAFLRWTTALGFSAAAVETWFTNQRVALAAADAAPAFVLTGVTGHWTFDEGSGTVAHDTSGNHFDGTLAGGATWITGGATFTASSPATDHLLHFNGTNAEVDVNASVLDTSGDYSVSAWVMLDTTNKWSTALSQDGTVNSGFFLQATTPNVGNTFAFSLIGADAQNAPTIRAFTPFRPLTGVWYHLVGVHSAATNQISLYVNGALIDTQSVGQAWNAFGHTVVGRGQANSSPTDYWPGKIDDVQVYRRALQASDVTALYGGSSLQNLNKDAIINHYNTLFASTPYPRSFAEPQWFKENIPFLDCPDSAIQDVYYYRWSSYKRHLRYGVPGVGYILTEFLSDVSYGGLYSSINAAAAFHIYEGRWLHDQRYLNDYQNFWLSGNDSRIQPRQYSFWIADSYYARYLVNADQNFLTNFLDRLDTNYQAWATPSNLNTTTGRYGTGYDSGVGLYYQTPVWDAMEYSLSSYQDPKDPYHGGEGYRPTINAYMYGDAQAIANIAALAGRQDLVTTYHNRASALKATMQTKLWNPALNFFVSLFRSNQVFNGRGLFDGREAIGYVPWYFNMPDPQYLTAWQYLMDPTHFYSTYGPTTGDQSYVASITANGFTVGEKLFMYQAGTCCRWDGPSWPYSTSQILTALANVLNNQSTSVVTVDNYYTLLRNYALTQYKSGYPYVAEAHDPAQNQWIYDTLNHSEHYNHSTYNDLVITGVIGLRPRADNVFEVNPLLPTGSNAWNYFCLEDVLYHGHMMTILYDHDGSRYGRGAGFQIYQDGAQIYGSPTVGHVKVNLSSSAPITLPVRFENYAAANILPGTQTNATAPQASYTFAASDSSVGAAFDGIINFDSTNPTRWSNYQSGHATDWLGVAFPSARAVNAITLHLYADTNVPGTRAPSSYNAQWWNGSAWVDATHQAKSPATPMGNAMNTVLFDQVTTTQVRVVFTNPLPAYVGVVEFEVWSPA